VDLQNEICAVVTPERFDALMKSKSFRCAFQLEKKTKYEEFQSLLRNDQNIARKLLVWCALRTFTRLAEEQMYNSSVELAKEWKRGKKNV
jgi:hypothetical protein